MQLQSSTSIKRSYAENCNHRIIFVRALKRQRAIKIDTKDGIQNINILGIVLVDVLLFHTGKIVTYRRRVDSQTRLLTDCDFDLILNELLASQ